MQMGDVAGFWNSSSIGDASATHSVAVGVCDSGSVGAFLPPIGNENTKKPKRFHPFEMVGGGFAFLISIT